MSFLGATMFSDTPSYKSVDPIMLMEMDEREYYTPREYSAPAVKDERRTATQKINALDFSMQKTKMMRSVEQDGKGWTKEQVDQGELWYKRFLVLCAEGEQVVPTALIDEFWHCHILDTRKYHADCQDIFGRYLHHFPYFGIRGEQDAKNLEKAFAKTQELFLARFGQKPCRASFCNSDRCRVCVGE